ncbi:protein CLP1 homolog isoform X2 [Belonocnema kinseyi]|uniref:protein CLP1 homolog isoform X2 n=1 Tax=Belonocnema kinseyi TaxID=2817044 RepID=UPI00143CF1EA|nr:protein CLP1 homolog isoform X2 [Belonocnema kinseyi]
MLKSGLAEVFGTDLVKNQKYDFFPGSNIAVFSWQGCTLELEGTPHLAYIGRETPMPIYLNCHAVLERVRELSEKEDSKGPVAMVVGPCDVGKSTICRLLANYALRMSRTPFYVNLDVGQVEFAVPGTLGALLLNTPTSVEEGFSQEDGPLVFHFGYDSPERNDTLYKHLITRVAEVCNDRMKTNQKAKHSGIIINTCGWTQKEGFRVLAHVAQAFEINAILVINDEKLYNDLHREMPHFVQVVLLPKSAGVVKRDQTRRAEVRNSSIHKYFYGIPSSPLHPCKIKVKFDDVSIYKIGAPSFSSTSSSLSTRSTNMTKLVPLRPIPEMRNHLLSVSFANSDEDDIVQSNVAGFLHVQDVNMQEKILTLLSPQPELKPNSILLLSEVKHCELH